MNNIRYIQLSNKKLSLCSILMSDFKILQLSIVHQENGICRKNLPFLAWTEPKGVIF